MPTDLSVANLQHALFRTASVLHEDAVAGGRHVALKLRLGDKFYSTINTRHRGGMLKKKNERRHTRLHTFPSPPSTRHGPPPHPRNFPFSRFLLAVAVQSPLTSRCLVCGLKASAAWSRSHFVENSLSWPSSHETHTLLLPPCRCRTRAWDAPAKPPCRNRSQLFGVLWSSSWLA